MKRKPIYVTFEYKDIIYIVKTDRLSAYKAWLIKKRIQQEKIPCCLTTKTIFNSCITFDKIEISRYRINLIGLISKYNILKSSVVMVEND